MPKLTESVLSSPIILDEAQELCDIINHVPTVLREGWKRCPRLVKIASQIPYQYLVDPDPVVVLRPELYRRAFDKHLVTEAGEQLLSSSISDSLRVQNIFAAVIDSIWVNKNDTVLMKGNLVRSITTQTLSPLSFLLFQKSSFWVALETLSTNALATCPLSWIDVSVPGDKDSFLINGDYVLWRPHEETCLLLLTWDQVLMFKDLASSRLLASLSIDYRPREVGGGLLSQSLALIISWQEKCIGELGNVGYEIIKGIEAVFKTAVFQCTEQLLEDDLLPLNNMMVKIRNKEVGIHGVDTLSSLLLDIVQSIGEDRRALMDAFGTMKLSGHPVVDPLNGIKKVKEIATKELAIPIGVIRRHRQHFCHMFARSFLNRHRRLPKMRFLMVPDITVNLRLWKIWRSPNPRLNLYEDNYDPSDWDYVRFGEEYTFDEGDDFLSLIADKAISCLLPEIWSTWQERIEKLVPKITTSRRALLEVLRQEEFCVGDIIKLVEEDRVNPEMYIVCIFPKEREMKLEPRMFAMLPLEIRTFLVCCEHNLANGILKDYSYLTMTHSYLDLRRKFIELTDPKTTNLSTTTTVFIEVDLSSWNLYMRGETVDPICHDLNDLYGKERCFDFGHKFFSRSTIFLRHPAYPPDIGVDMSRSPSPSSISYGGPLDNVSHQGGFEGLCQKPWSIFTSPMLSLAISKYGIPFVVIGSADNQVLVLDIPKERYSSSQQISALCRNILQSLEEGCKQLGHIVKGEECILSSSGFTFGKEVISKGALLPSTLKAVTRLFPTRTQDTPSSFEAIAGIWSDSIAATEKTDLMPLTYFLCNLQASISLRRELQFSSLHSFQLGEAFHWEWMTPDMRSDLVCLLLLMPANLGGIATASYLSFLYKGSADPLVQSLTSLDLIHQFSQTERLYEWLSRGTGMAREPDLTQLLEEPYSIPLNRASHPSSVIRNTVKERLMSINRNRTIQQILDLDSEEGLRGFKDWAGSFRPYHPKVIHDLYECIPYVEADRFASRFTNTRTLIGKAAGGSLGTASRVISADLGYWQDMARRLTSIFKTGKRDRSEPLSPLSLASKMRSRWGVGVMEDLGATHPFACIRLSSSIKDIAGKHGLIIACLPDRAVQPRSMCRGSQDPYLGGDTLPKKQQYGANLIETTPPLLKARQILEIRSLICEEQSQLWNDIGTWSQSRLRFPLSYLEPHIPKMYGGSIVHRYSTSTIPEGASVLSTFSFSTHLQMSTDLSGKLGSGITDYKLSYQELLMAVRTCISLLDPKTLMEQHVFYATLDLNSVDEIGDTCLVSAAPLLTTPPLLPANYYLTASSMTVKESVYSSLAWRGPRGIPYPNPDSEKKSLLAVREAIRALSVDSLTLRREVRRALNQPGRVSIGKSFIDIPESKKLPWNTLREALSLACLDSVLTQAVATAANHPLSHPVRSAVHSACCRVAYALYSAVSETLFYTPGYLAPGLTPGPGVHSARRAASVFSLSVAEEAMRILTQITHHTVYKYYRRAFESSRATEATVLLENLLLWSYSLPKDDPNWFHRLTVIARYSLHVRRDNVAEDIVLAECSPYYELATRRGEGPLEWMQTSPHEALRLIRGVEKGHSATCLSTSSQALLIPFPGPPCCRCSTVGGLLKLSNLRRKPKNNTNRVAGWLRSPLSFLSSALYRWAPVIDHTGPVVAVVGVGVGGLAGYLCDQGKEVYGFDLRTTLMSQREHFPMYIPPLVSRRENYQTHPFSWMSSGNINNPDFRNLFLHWCLQHSMASVVIDVESVDVHERIDFANFVSPLVQLTMVKIYSQGRAADLASSICSQGGRISICLSPVDPDDELTVMLPRGEVVRPLQFPLAPQNHASNWRPEDLTRRVNLYYSSEAVRTLSSLWFELFRITPSFSPKIKRRHILSNLMSSTSQRLTMKHLSLNKQSALNIVSLLDGRIPERFNYEETGRARLQSRIAGCLFSLSEW